MRQKNIEEKVRKTVQEKERKRIADAELNESGRSGVPEAPVTPSAPPIGGAVTAIKGMSKKLKQIPNPFRNTAPVGLMPGLTNQGEAVKATTPDGVDDRPPEGGNAALLEAGNEPEASLHSGGTNETVGATHSLREGKAPSGLTTPRSGDISAYTTTLGSYTRPLTLDDAQRRLERLDSPVDEGLEEDPPGSPGPITEVSEDLLQGDRSPDRELTQSKRVRILERGGPEERELLKEFAAISLSNSASVAERQETTLNPDKLGEASETSSVTITPEDDPNESESSSPGEWRTANQTAGEMESTRLPETEAEEARMGKILSQALTSEHRDQIITMLGTFMHSSQLAKRDGRGDPILCQKCKKAQVTRAGELCRKCQKGENSDKLDASLIDFGKKGAKPQAESTRNDEGVPRDGPSEITRLEMKKEKSSKAAIQLHCLQRRGGVNILLHTNQMTDQSEMKVRMEETHTQLENLQNQYANSFERLGLFNLHQEALQAKEIDAVLARWIYSAAERDAVVLASYQWANAPESNTFKDDLLYKWVGQIRVIHDILVSNEMKEWIDMDHHDLMSRPREPSRRDHAEIRWLNLSVMGKAILYLQELFGAVPGIRGPDEEVGKSYQARPVWNLLCWLDILQMESSDDDPESTSHQAAKPLKVTLWKFVRGIHGFFTYYLNESNADIKLKVREIAERKGELATEPNLMGVEGQQHLLTGSPRCQETMAETMGWHSIIQNLPIPGKLPRISISNDRAYKNVSPEGKYMSKTPSTLGSTLPKAIYKEYKDFMETRRTTRLDQDLSQIRWGAKTRGGAENSRQEKDPKEGLRYLDKPKKRWPGSPDPSDNDESGDDKPPPGGGGGGRRGGGGGGPPDDDPDDEGDDSDDSESETTDSETGRGRKKGKRKPEKKRCRKCGSDKHATGDRACKRRQKFCTLCQRTTHNFKRCPWRDDAPDCSRCGGRAHEFPRECPARLEKQRRKELRAFREDPDYLTPAGWKARLKLGADIRGNRIIPRQVQPYSAAAAQAQKRREYERQRAHDEFECEDLIERHDRIAKTALDFTMDDVKRQAIGRALKNADVDNIEELEDRRPGTLKKIEEKTTEMYIQKSVANAMGAGFKDISLEEMGWGKDCIFRGIPGEKYNIRQFTENFEKAKEAKGWDNIVGAHTVASRLRGPAKIFYDNLKRDYRTKNAAIFWPELKQHLWNAYYRPLDVFSRARMMQDVNWDPRTYNGSLKVYLQHIVNQTHETYEGKPDLERVTWREVREGEAIDKFLRTAPRAIIQRMKHEKCQESIDGFTAWLDDWEHTQRSTTDRSRNGRTLQVHALSEQDRAGQEDETGAKLDPGLMEYWETAGGQESSPGSRPENDGLEVNAMKKGGPPKVGPCHRCRKFGHLIRDCPEPEPEGDDGLETQAVARRRPALGFAGSAKNRPRRKFTSINRAKRPSPKKAPLQRGKRYYSTGSGRTYRVATISQPAEDDLSLNVIIGALEDLDPENEGRELNEEMEHSLLPLDWEIEELPSNPPREEGLEAAAMRGPGATPKGADQLARSRLPGDRDKPEVAGLELDTGLDEETSDPFGYDLGDGSFGSYDR